MGDRTLDALLWWTGALGWTFAGLIGLACSVAYAAQWAMAFVAWRWRLTRDFVQFVRQREDEFPG